MKRLGLVSLLLLGAAFAPSALAAPVWSPPQTISSPALFIDDPTLAFSRDGTALASWRWQNGTGNSATFGVRLAARDPGAGAFAAEREAPNFVAGPVLYGRRGAIGAAQQDFGACARSCRQHSRLRAVFGRADGRFTHRQTVRVGVRITHARLAANARGDAALAWFEDRGTRIDRVYVALRRPGHDFGRPRRLGTGRIRNVSVAVGPRGDVLVAWDARGVVRTRFRDAAGRAFHRTDTIRSEDAFFANLRTLVTLNGRAVVAWASQLLTEGGDTGPARFEAAVRPARAHRFRRAQLIEQQATGIARGSVALANDAAERQLFAWSGWDGAHYRVRAATTDAHGVFGAPVTLSGAGVDALLSDVATSTRGDAVAVWDQALTGDTPSQVLAAYRSGAAGAFGPPELVAASAFAGTPHVAFDPFSQRPSVVWSARDVPGIIPLADVKTYTRFATRTP